jgi:primary-amine oxidase
MEIPRAIAIFERYAGPEYKHQEMGKPNVSAERRKLVVRSSHSRAALTPTVG